jgi:hypothetical protein
MNPILFLIGWGVTLLMSVITLIIELPLKLVCAIISTIFITLVAVIAPIGENWNINVSDKIADNIEKFCEYSLNIKKWLFLKIYNVYKKTLL